MSHHHPWVRSIVFATVVVVAAPVLCLADEYGVEKDAPTFSTGETVEVSHAFCRVFGRSGFIIC